MAKAKKWTKFRHKLVTAIVHPFFYLYAKLKYRVKLEGPKESKKRPFLIIYNHQTFFDQFFVGLAFKRTVYYMATEDIFSNGLISKLLKFAVAPIPIKKQSADVHAVINTIRVAKEGGTIAIAPEGNRTYSGKTVYINPAIAPLIKKLGLPLAVFRIEGGYGKNPRWSDTVRGGKMRAYVKRVIEPEEYRALSNEELYELVKSELWVNEAEIEGIHKGKRRAEYLERALYFCPKCKLAPLKSEGNFIKCLDCGSTVEYTVDKKTRGVNCDFPYQNVGEWYDAQCEYIRGLDYNGINGKALFTDTCRLYEVIVCKKKRLIDKSVTLSLYHDGIVFKMSDGEENKLGFDAVSVASVLGRNKLNLYVGKQIFQIKSDKRFSALKYVNLCYLYKSRKEDSKNGKFLGL